MLIVSIVALLVFIIFTVIVASVDVDGVGLSRLNHFFWQHFGRSLIWEKITKYMGYLVILVVAGMLVWQIYQWVRRKKMLQIDKNLLIFDIIGLVFIAVYFFFELVVVNYRPELDHGVAKASYPSSHAMLFATVIPLLIWQVWHYLTSRPWCIVLTVLLSLLGVIGLIGRLLSGVHWFTDIVGGILISISMVCLYLYLVKRTKKLIAE